MKTIIGLVAFLCIALSAPAQWETAQLNVMNEYRESHGSTEIELPEYGYGVLACGGWTGDAVTATTEFFDLENGEWIPMPDMLTPRMDFAMASLEDGRVIVAGGYDGFGPLSLASTEIFDPLTNEWTAGPDLSVGRSFLRVTELVDGRLLFTGGSDGNEQVATVDIFDPSDNTMIAAAPMNFARSSHTATVNPYTGTVLVAGGFNPAFGFQMDECEAYSADADIWVTVSPLSIPRDNHACSFVANDNSSSEGVFIVSGGRVYDPGLDHFVGLANAEIIDAYGSLDAWEEVSIASAMSYHHAIVDANQAHVLIAGGADYTGIGVENTYQNPLQFIPASNTSETLLSSASIDYENRYRSSSTALYGGNMCVISGGDEGGVGTAELWYANPFSVEHRVAPRNGLFPNPAVDRMRITGERFERWEVIDANGKIVGNGNEWYVEVAHLADGRYNLAIYTDGTANTYGFVKVGR